MESQKALLKKLADGGDLNGIRYEIANLVIHHLERCKTFNNPAALDHFTNAVGSLTLNINAPCQPATIGLKTCLLDLEKAEAVINSNVPMDDLRTKRSNQISYDMLIEATQNIRDSVSQPSAKEDKAA